MRRRTRGPGGSRRPSQRRSTPAAKARGRTSGRYRGRGSRPSGVGPCSQLVWIARVAPPVNRPALAPPPVVVYPARRELAPAGGPIPGRVGAIGLRPSRRSDDELWAAGPPETEGVMRSWAWVGGLI